MNNKIAIWWVTNDMRLNDNPLVLALENYSFVIPVFTFGTVSPQTRWISELAKVPESLAKYSFSRQPLSEKRISFLNDSLSDLDCQLHELGNGLFYSASSLVTTLESLLPYIRDNYADCELELLCSVHFSSYELDELKQVKSYFSKVRRFHTSTLFTQKQLPFELKELPDIFTTFRKKVERIEVRKTAGRPLSLPKNPIIPRDILIDFKSIDTPSLANDTIGWKAGEKAALDHFHDYTFGTKKVETYKETRNGLLGTDFSTRMSVWLAYGSVSPVQLWNIVKEYEQKITSNESTYWVCFELLWREYFKWIEARYGSSIFHASGVNRKYNKTKYQPSVFEAWCLRRTGNDWIDGFMKELLHTGWMSNRGRQNVASYLVHHLKQDWRLGAAWFEFNLLDFDVASNYGNWMYVAGVGNDPRENRIFSPERQAAMYDPDKKFISYWKNLNY